MTAWRDNTTKANIITITETGFCHSGLKRRKVSKTVIPNTDVSQSAFSTLALRTSYNNYQGYKT
jgi:hypothetical protein